MKIDILFPAFNRATFTMMALACLDKNTDWSRVRRLYLYEDGSVDGADRIMQAYAKQARVPCELIEDTFGGPVAIMNDYLDRASRTDTTHFAKVDNDTCVPAGWLGELIGCMEAHPELDLLGMEALDDLPLLAVGGKLYLSPQYLKAGFANPVTATKPYHPHTDPRRSYRQQHHIGGIGLMKNAAFVDSRPKADGRFGFTHWQEVNDALVKGFLFPRLPVCLLDRVPVAPWSKLSARYIANGWQRAWGPYDADMSFLWDWFDPGRVIACAMCDTEPLTIEEQVARGFLPASNLESNWSKG